MPPGWRPVQLRNSTQDTQRMQRWNEHNKCLTKHNFWDSSAFDFRWVCPSHGHTENTEPISDVLKYRQHNTEPTWKHTDRYTENRYRLKIPIPTHWLVCPSTACERHVSCQSNSTNLQKCPHGDKYVQVQVQVQVLTPQVAYKYEYKYFKTELEYNSSTSTSTKYYISAKWIRRNEATKKVTAQSNDRLKCRDMCKIMNNNDIIQPHRWKAYSRHPLRYDALVPVAE